MITKEEFINYVGIYKDGADFLSRIDDEGLNLYDTLLTKSADYMFQAWLEQITSEEGQDLIYWWLFEDVEKIITEDAVDINVESLEDFANYLKEHEYI